MILPVICFVGGLVAMGRTKPKTTVRKLLCLGPRTGFIYHVEEFPEVGGIVVRAPNGSAIAQFIRASMREPGKAGLVYQTGQGDPRMLELIRRDFGVEVKLAAVPAPVAAPSMSPAAAALTEAQRELYWSTLAYRAPETLSADQKRIVDAMSAERDPRSPAPPAAASTAPHAHPQRPTPQTGRSTP